MPEKLLFMADNLFDVLQYPGHTIVGDQEAGGFEAYHVATARRQAADAWRPTTANADHTLKVTCDQLRGADLMVIDRASNHIDRSTSPPSGKRFILEHSADDFTTTVSVFDANTIPGVPGGMLSSTIGAVSDEYVWAKSFTPDGAYGWRVTSKAMGAGILQSITGLWLGKSWAPSNFVLFEPTQDRTFNIKQPSSESPYGWVGRGKAVRRREGTIIIKPADEADYDMINWQVLGLYARGVPAWIIHDKVDGSRDMFLARCPDGVLDWGKKVDWGTRAITIPFEEEQVGL